MKVGFTKINETMAFGVPEPERISISLIAVRHSESDGHFYVARFHEYSSKDFQLRTDKILPHLSRVAIGTCRQRIASGGL